MNSCKNFNSKKINIHRTDKCLSTIIFNRCSALNIFMWEHFYRAAVKVTELYERTDLTK